MVTVITYDFGFEFIIMKSKNWIAIKILNESFGENIRIHVFRVLFVLFVRIHVYFEYFLKVPVQDVISMQKKKINV